MESTNFSLNDNEFEKIREISKYIDSSVLVLFWQFAIKALDELNIVSNQHLSIEMFLTRLMYISAFKPKEDVIQNNDLTQSTQKLKNDSVSEFKNDTINQIKNVTQEKKLTPNLI